MKCLIYYTDITKIRINYCQQSIQILMKYNLDTLTDINLDLIVKSDEPRFFRLYFKDEKDKKLNSPASLTLAKYMHKSGLIELEDIKKLRCDITRHGIEVSENGGWLKYLKSKDVVFTENITIKTNNTNKPTKKFGKSATIIGLIAVIIAAITMLFGDNLYERYFKSDNNPVLLNSAEVMIENSVLNTNNTTQLDTFVSEGNQIVFIKPKLKELKELSNNKDFKASYSDFSYNINKVVDKFGVNDNLIVFPSEDIIEIVAFDGTKSYVNKKESKKKIGFILNSNKREPIVEFGMFSYEYLIKKVNIE